jgi:addiction module RelB/DinJ family antitoxin
MATTKANVNVKIDANVKETAAQMLASMGIDLTTAVDMFFRQIITERQLPFQPRVMLTLEEQLAAAIEKNRPKPIRLEVDENGAILIDKNLHPNLYDWAVNG